MAIGKNKLSAKKRSKKRNDPFLRKDWYTVRAPNVFPNREAGKTLITKTTGNVIASEQMKGRVFEVSLADLSKSEDDSYRKIKLRCDEVEGSKVLTNFHGMDLTRDKIGSLVKKWQTIIECRVDVTTTDGTVLRLFAIAFTQRRPNQVKKTTYAQQAQVKAIRAQMVKTIMEQSKGCGLKELTQKFITESIGREIEKKCASIFPIHNCYIRKVKLLQTPKFDLSKFMDLHQDAPDVGARVDRENPAVAPTTLAGSGGRL